MQAMYQNIFEEKSYIRIQTMNFIQKNVNTIHTQYLPLEKKIEEYLGIKYETWKVLKENF